MLDCDRFWPPEVVQFLCSTLHFFSSSADTRTRNKNKYYGTLVVSRSKQMGSDRWKQDVFELYLIPQIALGLLVSGICKIYNTRLSIPSIRNA